MFIFVQNFIFNPGKTYFFPSEKGGGRNVTFKFAIVIQLIVLKSLIQSTYTPDFFFFFNSYLSTYSIILTESNNKNKNKPCIK